MVVATNVLTGERIAAGAASAKTLLPFVRELRAAGLTNIRITEVASGLNPPRNVAID